MMIRCHRPCIPMQDSDIKILIIPAFPAYPWSILISNVSWQDSGVPCLTLIYSIMTSLDLYSSTGFRPLEVDQSTFRDPLLSQQIGIDNSQHPSSVAGKEPCPGSPCSTRQEGRRVMVARTNGSKSRWTFALTDVVLIPWESRTTVCVCFLTLCVCVYKSIFFFFLRAGRS